MLIPKGKPGQVLSFGLLLQIGALSSTPNPRGWSIGFITTALTTRVLPSQHLDLSPPSFL